MSNLGQTLLIPAKSGATAVTADSGAFTVGSTDLADNTYWTSRGAGAYHFHSPLARAVFTTDSLSVDLGIYSENYTGVSLASKVLVRVNGAFHATVAATQVGAATITQSLPAGSAKTVELIPGDQNLNGATPEGTFLVSAAFGAGQHTSLSTPDPAARIAIYGDSIASGASSTTRPKDSWPQRIREAYYAASSGAVTLEGHGARSFYDDANTSQLRAALVTQLLLLGPTRLWIQIGTNDYGLNKWAAAAFGTAYAALLDDLHTADPALLIWCQTPILRGTETANGSGSTLGNYRTQISTAVSTRTAYCTLVDGTTLVKLTTISANDSGDFLHPSTIGNISYAASIRHFLSIAPTVANDAFTDADTTTLQSHTASDGGTWTKHGSATADAVITDANRLRNSATLGQSLGALYYHSYVPPDADYDVLATAVLKTDNNESSVGICGRMNTAANTYYMFRYNSGTDQWQLLLLNGGAASTLQSAAATLVANQAYSMRLVMRGTTIKGFVDGVEVVGATDATVAPLGRAGLRMFAGSGNTTGVHMDAFSVEYVTA